MKKIKTTNDNIAEIIRYEINRLGDNADLNHIDVSDITHMAHLFSKSKFNGDISKWNVSNVTDMSFMFYNSQFNGDISKWNVSNVQDMEYMFSISSFNGDISKWNVSNVINMRYMFYDSSFNQTIKLKGNNTTLFIIDGKEVDENEYEKYILKNKLLNYLMD